MNAVLQAEITKQVDRLCNELAARNAEHERILPYFKRLPGSRALPQAVVSAKLVNAYLHLQPMSIATWGKLVVASKLDRLEVNGLTSPSDEISRAIWEGVWQENELNMESKLAHRAALLDGRSHATVWPRSQWLFDDQSEPAGTDDGPDVTFDDCTTMIVEYAEGSRRVRTGALRRWVTDDDEEFINLYRPEGIYKFVSSKDDTETSDSFKANGVRWKPREVAGEPWPLPNPLRVLTNVELGVNRELQSGRFTVCRGEFADETGLLDRVNLLTFLGMVLAVSMSFPLRVLIGDKIVRDDEGNEVPPFDAHIGGLAQLEDPKAKLDEYKAADRGALSIYGELAQFATSTTTPRHYFPSEGVIANVSAETITAFEGPMHATVKASHQPTLGSGHEEILRIGGLMLPGAPRLSRRAHVTWADHQSRSLGEQASAFAQLGGEGGLPWQARAEIALGLGQDDLRRYEQDQAGSALAQIIAAARQPAVPSSNGDPPPALPAVA